MKAMIQTKVAVSEHSSSHISTTNVEESTAKDTM